MAAKTTEEYLASPELVVGPGRTEYNSLPVTRVDKQVPNQMFGKKGVGYVLFKPGRTRPTRLLRSDAPIKNLKLGSTLWLSDGVAGIKGNLGKYVVVGCIDYDSGEVVGETTHIAVATVEL
jgi:hypothetical protein